ncbi:MAG: hypothetical protein NW216_01050 [Hyphomicrobium sp.]|nr:hypothetical protein [Hyphomicrobium sp.]
MIVDALFLLATGAFGWGLSLATYRLFALRNGWPMGALHADLPAVPAVVGLLCLVIGLLFAAARGPELGGWVIVLFGVLLATFWTGFLRVGSQISLFLAPIATMLLLAGWLTDIDRVQWVAASPSPALSVVDIVPPKMTL